MKKKNKLDRKKAARKRNKIIKRVFLVLIAILLIISITFTALFFYYRNQGKQNIMPDLEDVEYNERIEYDGHIYEYNKDVATFAFIGVDQRDMEEAQGTDFVGANDTNIVVAINTVSGEVNIIAIPRETVVDIDKYQNGEYLGVEKDRLALAYAYGDGAEISCQNTVDAISRVLKNVPIQKYFALDLDGIKPINDSIGGVMLKSKYDLPQYDVNIDDVVTLKGDMAESYVRARSMTDIGSSHDRSDRQVQYLQSFAEQVYPAVMLNFGTIADLYSVSSQYSQTNMTLREVTYLSSLIISKSTNGFDSTILEGEMRTEQDSAGEGMVHGLFTPDEDKLMQTVLDTFYLRVS